MTQTPEMRAIGDLAIYGTCTVRISSVTGRGIAAPFYRFSCVDYGHEHPKGWGDLTSHRLLADVPPPDWINHRPVVCDTCKDVAYADGIVGDIEQAEVMRDYGNEYEQHDCEKFGLGHPCECTGDHRGSIASSEVLGRIK